MSNDDGERLWGDAEDNPHDYVVPVGKWRGRTLGEVYAADNGYITWLSNISPADDSPHAFDWLEARQAAKRFLQALTAPVPANAIACHYCARQLTFASVLMLTPNVIAVKCPCRSMPIRATSSQPLFEEAA